MPYLSLVCYDVMHGTEAHLALKLAGKILHRIFCDTDIEILAIWYQSKQKISENMLI